MNSIFTLSTSLSSNDDTTGADAFLLGLNGISNWLKLSARDKDNLLGDILDILGRRLYDDDGDEVSSSSVDK